MPVTVSQGVSRDIRVFSADRPRKRRRGGGESTYLLLPGTSSSLRGQTAETLPRSRSPTYHFGEFLNFLQTHEANCICIRPVATGQNALANSFKVSFLSQASISFRGKSEKTLSHHRRPIFFSKSRLATCANFMPVNVSRDIRVFSADRPRKRRGGAESLLLPGPSISLRAQTVEALPRTRSPT